MNESARNGAKRGSCTILVLACLLSLSLSGCASTEDGVVRGQISYSGGVFRSAEADTYFDYFFCYVYLDDDADISNGYKKFQKIEITQACDSLSFEIDASDIPVGSYYLLGAYDFAATLEEMSAETMSGWEANGWYGSSSIDPPASPSVKASGTYNVILYGRG